MLLYLFLSIFLLANSLYKFFSRICCWRSEACKRCAKAFTKVGLWRFILESYLELYLFILIKFKVDSRFETIFERIDLLIALLFSLFFILLPNLILLLSIRKKTKEIQLLASEGINVSKKQNERVDLIHDLVFLLHRLIFGSLLVCVPKYSIIFIFLITIL